VLASIPLIQPEGVIVPYGFQIALQGAPLEYEDLGLRLHPNRLSHFISDKRFLCHHLLL
jgi:hypothetical protein